MAENLRSDNIRKYFVGTAAALLLVGCTPTHQTSFGRELFPEAVDRCGFSPLPVNGSNDGSTSQLFELVEYKGDSIVSSRQLRIIRSSHGVFQYYVDDSQAAPQILLPQYGYDDGSADTDITVTDPYKNFGSGDQFDVDVIPDDTVADKFRVNITPYCSPEI